MGTQALVETRMQRVQGKLVGIPYFFKEGEKKDTKKREKKGKN